MTNNLKYFKERFKRLRGIIRQEDWHYRSVICQLQSLTFIAKKKFVFIIDITRCIYAHRYANKYDIFGLSSISVARHSHCAKIIISILLHTARNSMTVPGSNCYGPRIQ